MSRTKISGCGGPAIRALERFSASSSGPLADAMMRSNVNGDCLDTPVNAIDAARDILLETSADPLSYGLSSSGISPLVGLLPASIFCSHSDLRGNAGGAWDVPAGMWQDHTAFSYANQTEPIAAAKLAARANAIAGGDSADSAATPVLVVSASQADDAAPPADALPASGVELVSVHAVRAPASTGVPTVDACMPIKSEDVKEEAFSAAYPELPPCVVSAEVDVRPALLVNGTMAPLEGSSSSPTVATAVVPSSGHRRMTRYAVGGDDVPVGLPSLKAANDMCDSDSDAPSATANGKRKRVGPVAGVAVVVDDVDADTSASAVAGDPRGDDELADWLRPSRHQELRPSRLRAGGGLENRDRSLHLEQVGVSVPLASDRRRLFVHASTGGHAAVYLLASARRRQILTSAHDLRFDLPSAAPAAADSVTDTQQMLSCSAPKDVTSRTSSIVGVADAPGDATWKSAALADAGDAFLVAARARDALGPATRVHSFAVIHADAALGGLSAAMARTHHADSNMEAALSHHRAVAVTRVMRGSQLSQHSHDVAAVRAAAQAQERALMRLASGSSLDSGGGGVGPTGSPRFVSPLSGGLRPDPYAKVYISAPGQRADFHAVASAVPSGEASAAIASAPAAAKPKKKKPQQQQQQMMMHHGGPAGGIIPAAGGPRPLRGVPPHVMASYNALLLQQQMLQQQMLMQQHLQATLHAAGLPPRALLLPGLPGGPAFPGLPLPPGLNPSAAAATATAASVPGASTDAASDTAGLGTTESGTVGAAASATAASFAAVAPLMQSLPLRAATAAPRAALPPPGGSLAGQQQRSLMGQQQLSFMQAMAAAAATGTLSPEMCVALQYQQAWMQQSLAQQAATAQQQALGGLPGTPQLGLGLGGGALAALPRGLHAGGARGGPRGPRHAGLPGGVPASATGGAVAAAAALPARLLPPGPAGPRFPPPPRAPGLLSVATAAAPLGSAARPSLPRAGALPPQPLPALAGVPVGSVAVPVASHASHAGSAPSLQAGPGVPLPAAAVAAPPRPLPPGGPRPSGGPLAGPVHVPARGPAPRPHAATAPRLLAASLAPRPSLPASARPPVPTVGGGETATASGAAAAGTASAFASAAAAAPPRGHAHARPSLAAPRVPTGGGGAAAARKAAALARGATPAPSSAPLVKAASLLLPAGAGAQSAAVAATAADGLGPLGSVLVPAPAAPAPAAPVAAGKKRPRQHESS